MATEGPQLREGNMVAAADLSALQYHFVKVDSNGQIAAIADATDKPFGVLQNAPVAGEAANVCVFGRTKVQQSASIAPGTPIGVNATGEADAKTYGTDKTEAIIGVMIENGGADNAIGSAWIAGAFTELAVTSA